MTGTAHGAETMEIVPHGPHNHRLEHASFHSQIQRSTDLTTGAPLSAFFIEAQTFSSKNI